MKENSDYRHEVFKYIALLKINCCVPFSTTRRRTKTCGIATDYQNKGQYYNALMRELL